MSRLQRSGDRARLVGALLDEPVRQLQEAFLTGPPPLVQGAGAAARLEAFVMVRRLQAGADLDDVLAAARALARADRR